MTSHGKLAVATLLIALVRISTAIADDSLTHRFLQEAPRKWHEYESLLRGFDSASEHTTEFVPLGSKGEGEKQSQYESDQIIVDGSQTNSFKKQGLDVNVSNPDYFFTLRQLRPSDTNTFAVVYLSPRSQRSEEKFGSNFAVHAERSRIGIIWHLYPLDLHDIITSPTFKVIAATEVQHVGESAVKIDFEFNSKSKEVRPFDKYTGSVRLLPEKFWAVIEGTITVDDPKKQLGSYVLRNQLGSFGSVPVVVGSEYLTYDPDHNLIATMKSKHSWSKFDGKRDIFRLSGYGL
jgi:hypothetical protein